MLDPDHPPKLPLAPPEPWEAWPAETSPARRLGRFLLGPGAISQETALAWTRVQADTGAAWGFSAEPAAFLDFAGWPLLARAGARLVRWLVPPAQDPPGLARPLRAAVRAGLWNEIVPLGGEGEAAGRLLAWAAANPNLAHSWREPAGGPPPEAAVFPGAPPLPGQPFWRGLPGTGPLLAWLERCGPRRVMRWRLRADGGSVYALGEALVFDSTTPANMSPEELAVVHALVAAGGAVGGSLLAAGLARAYLVATCREEGALVGASALKRPREAYLVRLLAKTGLDLTGFVERGYTSVRPEYRGLGIGTRLLELETAGARREGVPVYSIISRDNPGAEEMARRNRTSRVASFYSEIKGKELGLWMPAWVLDDPRLRPPGLTR